MRIETSQPGRKPPTGTSPLPVGQGADRAKSPSAEPAAQPAQQPAELRNLQAELARRGIDSTHLHFEVDQQQGQVVVHIIDDQSGAVIRTIPQDLRRYLNGLILSQTR